MCSLKGSLSFFLKSFEIQNEDEEDDEILAKSQLQSVELGLL